ncbi:MAG: hypothetical protein ACREQ8_04665 [Woeseiaceae bacterium]
MSIRSLKKRADQLASEAGDLRSERNRRAAESLALLRQRVASPVGLAMCFGVGVAAGLKSPRRESNGAGTRSDGAASRVLQGPLGAAAIKLASAFIAGAFLQPDKGDGAASDVDSRSVQH